MTEEQEQDILNDSLNYHDSCTDDDGEKDILDLSINEDLIEFNQLFENVESGVALVKLLDRLPNGQKKEQRGMAFSRLIAGLKQTSIGLLPSSWKGKRKGIELSKNKNVLKEWNQAIDRLGGNEDPEASRKLAVLKGMISNGFPKMDHVADNKDIVEKKGSVLDRNAAIAHLLIEPRAFPIWEKIFGSPDKNDVPAFLEQTAGPTGSKLELYSQLISLYGSPISPKVSPISVPSFRTPVQL